MKTLITVIAMTLSFGAFACPDLTGTFYDADSESSRSITQEGCVSTTWSDLDGKITLVSDNVERVLQQEGTMTAYAKVSFTAEDLVIDIRMDYAGNNQFDLPVRWITSYRIDKFGNMVEKIEPFKADGSQQGTEYVTFRRIK